MKSALKSLAVFVLGEAMLRIHDNQSVSSLFKM